MTAESATPPVRFIDLFAGIGGMRLAFEEADAECVYTSEWNRFAQQTYAANFPDTQHPVVGDITEVDVHDVPDHEILVAGFPCQPFSIAGVSKKNALGRKHGFADEAQGTLFFNIAQILDAKRPKAFLLENVKNLQSHDQQRTFATIMRILDQAGYVVTSRVIDAQQFVPQHRERIFLVGTLDGEMTPFDVEAVQITGGDDRPTLGQILHSADTAISDAPFVVSADGSVDPKYTLTPRLWDYLQAYAAKHRAAGNGFGFGLVDPRDQDAITRTLSARYYKDGSEVLIRQDGDRPRRLTPREAARLMGFDVSRFPRHRDRYGLDEWLIPVSDTQAYRQFGNAVVPEVVQTIAEPLVSAIRAVLVGPGEAEAAAGEVEMQLPVAA